MFHFPFSAQDIESGIGVVFGTAAGAFMLYVRQNGHRRTRRVSRQLERDQQIKEQLIRACIELGAMRAYVSVIHYDDTDPLKNTKTRVYEHCMDGVSYQTVVFQEVLLSTIPDEMALVVETGPSFTPVEKLPAGKFKWLCTGGNVAAVARAGIWRDGKPAAFVGLDFPTIQRPDNIDLLLEIAGRVDLLMSDVRF